jgi:hypothetical protein
MCLNIAIVFLVLLPRNVLPASETGSDFQEYIIFPKAYETWNFSFLTGVGITKLPTNIVEEEINTSPVLFGSARLDLPWNFSSRIYFASNYISNIGTLSVQLNMLNSFISIAPGIEGSMWFGHVEMESIKLKSNGIQVKPYVSAGIDFGDILLTGSLEMQFGSMTTYSEDSLLARFNQPRSCYTLRFTLEQPLWGDQWVLLGLGLNYATFYYQSWLSYSAIRQYLFYPEIYFGFIL